MRINCFNAVHNGDDPSFALPFCKRRVVEGVVSKVDALWMFDRRSGAILLTMLVIERLPGTEHQLGRVAKNKYTYSAHRTSLLPHTEAYTKREQADSSLEAR